MTYDLALTAWIWSGLLRLFVYLLLIAAVIGACVVGWWRWRKRGAWWRWRKRGARHERCTL